VETFMTLLEEMAELVVDLTCKGKVALDLLTRNVDEGYIKFKVSRGASKSLIIKLTTSSDGTVIKACKVRRSYEKKYKATREMGELRDCIFAHLVPNMRVFSVLKSVLQERLSLEFTAGDSMPRKGLCLLGEDKKQKLQIWMDEEDRIKVSGGCISEEVQTFELDEEPLTNDDKYFFFENPFLEERPGSHPTLMPQTEEVVSLVLGTWSLNSLGMWTRDAESMPSHQLQVKDLGPWSITPNVSGG